MQSRDQHRNRILYWKGVLDPYGLSADYHLVIQKILAGEYAALDLEKLRNTSVFSVRINREHRMLFTTVEVNDEPQLMLLDVVLNHDYDKSAFLKPAVLRNYLLLNGQDLLVRSITAKDFEQKDSLDVKLVAKAYECEFVAAEFFKHKFIEFSDEQQQTVRAKLPLLLTGAAGAGKSCMAVSIISNYAADCDDFTLPVLYVTESQGLCNNMRSNWLSLPISQWLQSGQVQFKSYQELIIELDPLTATLQPVGYENFCKFITKRIKSLRKNARSAQKKIEFRKELFSDKETLYQEIRIISGVDSVEEYKKLGSAQSLLADKAEREWLFAEYLRYIDNLKQQNAIDFALYATPIKARYQLIVVDEAQDLSHLQLAVLNNLVLDSRICYCEDARQSLKDNLPKTTYYSKLLAFKAEQRNLSASYRCPAAVINIANVMSRLVGATTGHKQPEIPLQNAAAHPGYVEWHEDLTAPLLQVLREAAKQPGFAVVTLAEFKKQIEALFATPLVFTVEEIKGLEFETILAYRLMDAPLYFEANDLLDPEKNAFTSEKFGPAFNALYTACTRATKKLLLVQDNPDTRHQLRFITKKIKAALPKVLLLEEEVHKLEQDALESWFVQARLMLSSGKENVARQIFITKLKLKDDDFLKFKQAWQDAERVKPTVEEVKPDPIVLSVVQPTSAVVKQTTKQAKPKPVLNSAQSLAADNYIKGMLAKPNIYNLKKLFAHKNAAKYLFNHAAKDNECLFTVLLDDINTRSIVLKELLPAHLEQLAPFFTQSALCRSEASTDFMPPLYWLSLETELWNKLTSVKSFQKSIIENITVEALCAKVNCYGVDDGSSALYWLSCDSSGVSSLNLLLATLPELPERMKDVLFIRRLNKNGFITSIFQNFFDAGISGFTAVNSILDAKPELAEAVKLRDLFPQYQNVWPELTKVNQYGYGKRLIKKLQTLNTNIYERDLTCVDLATLYSLDREICPKDNPDYFEQALLSPNSTLCSKLMTDECVSLYLYNVIGEVTPPLFTMLMAKSDTRNRMLETIVSIANSNLKYITPYALGACYEGVNAVPSLFWMAGNENITSQLLNFCKINDKFINVFLYPTLMQTMTVSEYYKSGLPQGFNALHNKHYRPLISRDGLVSTFSLLALTSAGLALLADISLKGPRMLITREHLFSATILDVVRKKPLCLFEYLIEAKGHFFLNEIFDKNKDFYGQVDINILKADNNKLINMLFETVSGVIFITRLMVANPAIASYVGPYLLSALHRNSRDDSPILNPLYKILGTQYGLMAVADIIEANPGLVNDFDRTLFVEYDKQKISGLKRAIMNRLFSTPQGSTLFAEIAFMMRTAQLEHEVDTICRLAIQGNQKELRRFAPALNRYLNAFSNEDQYYFSNPIEALIHNKYSALTILASQGQHAAVELLLSMSSNRHLSVGDIEGSTYRMLTSIAEGFLIGGYSQDLVHIIYRIKLDWKEETIQHIFASLAHVSVYHRLDDKKTSFFKAKAKLKWGVKQELRALASAGRVDDVNSLLEILNTGTEACSVQWIGTIAAGYAGSKYLSDDEAIRLVNKCIVNGASIPDIVSNYVLAGRIDAAFALMQPGMEAEIIPALLQTRNYAGLRQLLTLDYVAPFKFLQMCLVSRCDIMVLYMFESRCSDINYFTFIENYYIAEGNLVQLALWRKRAENYNIVMNTSINNLSDTLYEGKNGWLSNLADVIKPLPEKKRVAIIKEAVEAHAPERCRPMRYLAHFNDEAMRNEFAKVLFVGKSSSAEKARIMAEAAAMNRIMNAFGLAFDYIDSLMQRYPRKNWSQLINYNEGSIPLNLPQLLALDPSLICWMLVSSQILNDSEQLYMLITAQLTGLCHSETVSMRHAFTENFYAGARQRLFAQGADKVEFANLMLLYEDEGSQGERRIGRK